MICAVCQKEPSEIEEYVSMAEQEDTLPEEFVRSEEGTYNSEEDVFYCTECYCNIGMPLGRATRFQ